MIDIKAIQPLFDDFAGIMQETASRLSGLAIEVGTPVVNIAAAALVFEHLTEPCAIAAALFSDPHPGGVIITAIPLPLGSVIPDRIVSPGSQASPGKLSDLHRGALREMFQQMWLETSSEFEKYSGKKIAVGGVEVEHASPADFISRIPALAMAGDYLAAVFPVNAGKLGEFEVVQLSPSSFMEHILDIADEQPDDELTVTPPPNAQGPPKKLIKNLEAPRVRREAVKATASRPIGRPSARLGSAAAAKRNLESLLDVPVEMKALLGHGTMKAENVMSIGPGSVVELKTLVGSPIGVYVNGSLMARANVVTLGEKFGVQIVEIVDPSKRLAEK